MAAGSFTNKTWWSGSFRKAVNVILGFVGHAAACPYGFQNEKSARSDFFPNDQLRTYLTLPDTEAGERDQKAI